MQRFGRFALIVFEIVLLTALILATRCANFQEVFVAGNVYFVDADCYARMTRAQMVREKPGLIIRHHAFENFPQGTTPHTTAPLDYLIVALSLFLNPFTANPLDLAGAFVSPLLSLLGGWFLWWWARRMKFRYRWVMLILYATSPILVHGTELGRPDHQSLLILLVTIAICAEWSSQTLQAVNMAGVWWLTSVVAWAVAIWVSAYEPLVLFLMLTATALLTNRRAIFARDRRAGWILFAAIIAIAFAIERRVPSIAILQSNSGLTNWASTIGELAHASPMNPVWLNWCGYLVRRTGFDLDEHQNAEKRRAGTARPTLLRPSHRHVFPHHLAGAMGIFFCFDFSARASSVARADQIRRRGLDCVRVVDISDFTRLGRTALAKRSAISWPGGTAD